MYSIYRHSHHEGSRRKMRRYALRSGLLVLALAATAGLATGTTSWASGVTVESDAQMMATDASSYPLLFDESIQTTIVELNASDESNGAVTTSFYRAYVSATQDYGTALLSAAQVYSDTYADNPAAAKDMYVDSFNRARADYFNRLEAARNALIAELSGQNDAARNMFTNEYNAARDQYNNQLEAVKNQIAALEV